MKPSDKIANNTPRNAQTSRQERRARLNLDQILSQLPKGKLPPVHSWHPERVGEIDIQIARNGAWFHEGTIINRHRMVKLFSTIIRLDEDNRYYLVTPVEKLAIRVDDVPFTAVEMQVYGTGLDQILTFRTNVDEEIIVGPDHSIRVAIDIENGEPSPYVLVRGNLEALIVRAVFYDLVELAVERDIHGETKLGVWSAGEYFVIGAAEEAED